MEPPPPPPPPAPAASAAPSAVLNIGTAQFTQVVNGSVESLTVAPRFGVDQAYIDPRLRRQTQEHAGSNPQQWLDATRTQRQQPQQQQPQTQHRGTEQRQPRTYQQQPQLPPQSQAQLAQQPQKEKRQELRPTLLSHRPEPTDQPRQASQQQQHPYQPRHQPQQQQKHPYQSYQHQHQPQEQEQALQYQPTLQHQPYQHQHQPQEQEQALQYQPTLQHQPLQPAPQEQVQQAQQTLPPQSQPPQAQQPRQTLMIVEGGGIELEHPTTVDGAPKLRAKRPARLPKATVSSMTKGHKLSRFWKKEHEAILNRACSDIQEIISKAQEATGASSGAIRSHCLGTSRHRRRASAWNMLVQYMRHSPKIVQKYDPEVPVQKKDQSWKDYMTTDLTPFWNKRKEEAEAKRQRKGEQADATMTGEDNTHEAFEKWLLSLKSLTVAKISAEDVNDKMREERKFLHSRAIDLESNEAIVQIAFLIHPDPLIKPVAATTGHGEKILHHVMRLWKRGDTPGHLLERFNAAVESHAPKAYLELGDPGSEEEEDDGKPLTGSPQPVQTPAATGATASGSSEFQPNKTPKLPPPEVVPSGCLRSKLPSTHGELVPYVARQLLRLLSSHIYEMGSDAEAENGDCYQRWLDASDMGSRIPYAHLFDILRSYGLCVDGWPVQAQALLVGAKTVDGVAPRTLEVYAGGLQDTSMWQTAHVLAIADVIAGGVLGVEAYEPPTGVFD
ncbi:hypothetical protein OC842_006639 [Tilletia horrida]|uniref:Uncharacterized protein n=1 Tax=Tilletia horrida TaxID=155126 RepID=A0AAN6JN68_9BASI|nr:hypothetical protein OC842_006639 [Tilletia horrida]